MNTHPLLRRAIVGLMCGLGALAAASAWADEGMWTLDNLPRALLKQRYGFEPTQAWLDKVMRASARIPGCSASFVSPDGLVMTNHHCAERCVGQLSTPDNDRVAKGFLARERGQEQRCPEMELNRLENITDVTEVMNAATAGKQGAAYQAAEDATRARLTRECRGSDAESTRCDLVTLYRGGRYQLYKYRRYSDVRLVWVPEFSVAQFGGDPDNFNFPRWSLDTTFLRAYEGGQPAKVADYFRFKVAGAEPGELTLVPGHPGNTQRQLTVAQLEALRDRLALQVLPSLSESRGALLQYGRQDAESHRLADGALQGVENGLKVIRGELEALSDRSLMETKRRAEQQLREFVAARPELKARVGDPWVDIEKATRAARAIGTEYSMIEMGQAFGSSLFQQARVLVRGAAERGKPNGERLREFVDTNLPQIEQRLRSPAPVYPAFEQARLTWSLNRLRSTLGADDATVKLVLGRRTPEQVAQALVSGSKLAQPAERLRLWNGGQAAIEQSDDPFIQLVRKLEPTARALRQRYEGEVQAVEREAAQRVAIASFAQTGPGVYPDATFSLRLSFGSVKGWEENGRKIGPYTDVAGLYARATGEDPFALPPSWVAAQGQLQGSQRFNFVTDNDIIGGNSGSPVINREAEIVGLAFDGNMPSIGGAFFFDDKLNRMVGLHSGAIVEALRKVYRADGLLQELLGKP